MASMASGSPLCKVSKSSERPYAVGILRDDRRHVLDVDFVSAKFGRSAVLLRSTYGTQGLVADPQKFPVVLSDGDQGAVGDFQVARAGGRWVG